MGVWRAAWRLTAIGGLVASFLVAAAFARSKARRRRFLHRWSRVTCRVLSVDVRVEGAPPRPPFLLVANHLGYVDVLVLASIAETVFVARGDMARWPVVGPAARAAGTLFIDRERRRDIPRALSGIQGALADGAGVVLFPEGTSSGGDAVLPFRPSLLDDAARRGMPVHWASLSYATPAGSPPASLAVCWWGEMTFFRHLAGLARLPGFEARVTFGGEPVNDGDRKVLAENLWKAVSSRFRPATC